MKGLSFMNARCYCVTINYVFDYLFDKEDIEERIKYAIWRNEIGESGNPHTQMMVILKDKMRGPAFKELLKRGKGKLTGRPEDIERFQDDEEPEWAGAAIAASHIEITMDRTGSRKYCMREDKSGTVFPFVEIGEWENSGQGARCDWNSIKNDIRKGTLSLNDIMDKYPGLYFRYRKSIIEEWSKNIKPRDYKPEVIIHYGPPGCGKTLDAVANNPGAFVKMADDKWWDGYDPIIHETVIIDEMSEDTGITYSTFLRMLDSYQAWVEIKGGMIPFLAKKIIITSNFKYTKWYPKKDVTPLKRRIVLERSFKREQPEMVEEPKVEEVIMSEAKIKELMELIRNGIHKTYEARLPHPNDADPSWDNCPDEYIDEYDDDEDPSGEDSSWDNCPDEDDIPLLSKEEINFMKGHFDEKCPSPKVGGNTAPMDKALVARPPLSRGLVETPKIKMVQNYILDIDELERRARKTCPGIVYERSPNISVLNLDLENKVEEKINNS